MNLMIGQTVRGLIGLGAVGLLTIIVAANGCGDDCVSQCVRCNDDSVSEAEKTEYCEGICTSDACAELIACIADHECSDDFDCPGSCKN